MHYLVHTLKNGKIIKYSLETNETSIGRDIVNQIVLNEKSISRRHCKLIHSQGKLRVIDLNSTNGSFINDQRIQESILDAGDTLRLGNIALNVEKDSDDQEPESPGILKPDMVHQNAIVETDEMKGKTIPTFSADATHQDLKIKEDAKKINTVLQEVNRVEDLTRFDMADLKNLKNTVTYFNILYELSRNVAQFMDLSELLDKTLEIIFTVIPAQNGLIVLIDEQTGAKVPVAYLGEQGKAAPDEKIELSLSISNRVLNLSEGILCNDVLGDDNLSISESVKHLNIKSILCAPLIVRNEAIGLIYIDNRTRNARFEEDDLTLLIAIANIVAISSTTRCFSANLIREFAWPARTWKRNNPCCSNSTSACARWSIPSETPSWSSTPLA